MCKVKFLVKILKFNVIETSFIISCEKWFIFPFLTQYPPKILIELKFLPFL